jgi:acetyl-CoA C-acetyltransferase
MCSPITDGAAAVILASGERARDLTDRPVWIRGTGQALDGFTLSSLPEDYSHWPSMKRAAESAYAMAGVGPREVDLAEVHDCFAIAEVIAYEELGFCEKGEGGRLSRKVARLRRRRTTHVAASGLRTRWARPVWRRRRRCFRGEAGPRQVPARHRPHA